MSHPVEQRVFSFSLSLAISLFTGYSTENALAQRFEGENIPTPSAEFWSRMSRNSDTESGLGSYLKEMREMSL